MDGKGFVDGVGRGGHEPSYNPCRSSCLMHSTDISTTALGSRLNLAARAEEGLGLNVKYRLC